MRNLSVKRLSVLMIGIRAWQGEKWSYDRPVKGHQEELIVSDSLLSTLPDKWQLDQPNLKLHELSEKITLEPTELDSEESFGPYAITEAQLATGFWLMGRLYVDETEAGKCGIDLDAVPVPGTLPVIWELNSNGKLDRLHNDCSVATAPPTYYATKKLEGFFALGDK